MYCVFEDFQWMTGADPRYMNLLNFVLRVMRLQTIRVSRWSYYIFILKTVCIVPLHGGPPGARGLRQWRHCMDPEYVSPLSRSHAEWDRLDRSGDVIVLHEPCSSYTLLHVIVNANVAQVRA